MNNKNKVVFIATDSSERVIPISRFTQGSVTSDTALTLEFDTVMEGGLDGRTTVSVTCSSGAKDVLQNILKQFANSRDLVVNLANADDNISSFSIAVAAIEGVQTLVGAGATTNLNVSDSGKVFFLSGADGTITYDLPAVAKSAGVRYTFIVTVASDNDINWASDGDNMIVSCTEFTGSGAAQVHLTDTATNLKMNCDTVNAVVGDRVEFYCNGTNWVALGFSNSQNATAFFAVS